VAESKHILTVNAGGASLKLALIEWATGHRLATEYIVLSQASRADQPQIRTHSDAFDTLLRRIDLAQVVGVGHRVVHGGTVFQQSIRISPKIKQGLERLNDLAPLHNPPALELINAVEQKLPDVPQVAAFDTAFHFTLPPTSYLYPVPIAWFAERGLRRFGFHGLNLDYCVTRAASMLSKATDTVTLVICHLGSGCSVTAIKGGRSIATTMGFTPLEGVMMATRSGSVDPGLLLHLLRHNEFTTEALEDVLNHQSGLKGVSGTSGDMRDVLSACKRGDDRAKLALDLYVTRIREGIGTMLMHTGRIDALVFTDGVGEHVPEVRAATMRSLQWLGIHIDETANANVNDADVDIAGRDSSTHVLVIHNGEEHTLWRETRRVLDR